MENGKSAWIDGLMDRRELLLLSYAPLFSKDSSCVFKYGSFSRKIDG